MFGVSRITEEGLDGLQDVTVAYKVNLVRSIGKAQRSCLPRSPVRDIVNLQQKLPYVLEGQSQLFYNL